MPSTSFFLVPVYGTCTEPSRTLPVSITTLARLGFAGGLSEAGLPTGHIPTALLFFSVGVETGHLLFVGPVLALLAIKLPMPRWALLGPPYAIGSVAMFWVIQRVAAF